MSSVLGELLQARDLRRVPPWTQVRQEQDERPARYHPKPMLRGVVNGKGKCPDAVSYPEALKHVVDIIYWRAHCSDLKAMTYSFVTEEIDNSLGIALKHRSPHAARGSGERVSKVRTSDFKALWGKKNAKPISFLA